MWVGSHSASSVRITAPPEGRSLRKVEPVDAVTSPHCVQCKQQCDKCCSCCSALCTECLAQEPNKQSEGVKISDCDKLADGDPSYSCNCPDKHLNNGGKAEKKKSRLKWGCF